jgi:hypothetical protein
VSCCLFCRRLYHFWRYSQWPRVYVVRYIVLHCTVLLIFTILQVYCASFFFSDFLPYVWYWQEESWTKQTTLRSRSLVISRGIPVLFDLFWLEVLCCKIGWWLDWTLFFFFFFLICCQNLGWHMEILIQQISCSWHYVFEISVCDETVICKVRTIREIWG